MIRHSLTLILTPAPTLPRLTAGSQYATIECGTIINPTRPILHDARADSRQEPLVIRNARRKFGLCVTLYPTDYTAARCLFPHAQGSDYRQR